MIQRFLPLYCHIHRPGPGVGGHCIPVYPWFLIESGLAKNLNMDLLISARKINDTMYLEIIDMIKIALARQKIPLKRAKIGILGVAFRPNVKEIRYAPSINLYSDLKTKLNVKVKVHDPYFTQNELIELGFSPGNVETILESDMIILLTAHRQYDVLKDFFLSHLDKVIDATDRLALEEAKWKIGRPNP